MNCCCCRPKTAGLRNTALHLCYCYYCTTASTVQVYIHTTAECKNYFIYNPYAVQYVLGTTYRTKCVNIIRSSLLTYAIHISGSKSNTVDCREQSTIFSKIWTFCYYFFVSRRKRRAGAISVDLSLFVLLYNTNFKNKLKFNDFIEN